MSLSVLVLAHRVPYPPNKGEKLRTFHQLRHLAGCGDRVHVLAPTADEADESNLSALGDHLGIAVDGARNRFRRFRMACGLWTAQPLTVRNFHFGSLQALLDLRLSEGRYDVILCTSSGMAQYLFESGFLRGEHVRKPALIMDFMDLDSAKWREYARMHRSPIGVLYGREAYLLRRYEQRVHERFDGCVFVAEREAALFAADLPAHSDRVHVIGNGVDTGTFRPSERYPMHAEVRCVFIGVMDYFPNEDAMAWFVAEVWPSLRVRWPDATMRIVGMNPSARVIALGKVLGVEVIGYVEDVSAWFQRATVFVAPFRIARGVQNKILQAFASGIPVVTTPAGAHGLEGSPGAEFLVAEGAEDFAARVRDVVERPELAAALRANALRLVAERYAWGVRNDALSRLIRHVGPRRTGDRVSG